MYPVSAVGNVVSPALSTALSVADRSLPEQLRRVSATALPDSPASARAQTDSQPSVLGKALSSARPGKSASENLLEIYGEQFHALRNSAFVKHEFAHRENKLPWKGEDLQMAKDVFGDLFLPFLVFRFGRIPALPPVRLSASELPTWHRTYIENIGGQYRVQSPKGCVQVEFMEMEIKTRDDDTSCKPGHVTEIDLTFSNRKKNTVRFDEGSHLAHCGIGIPTAWETRQRNWKQEHRPIYETKYFQPLVISPDEATVFCLLQKKDGSPVLQKIQENSSEQIDMPADFHEDIQHVSGMACNAAGVVFIYSGGKTPKLHVLEKGLWHRVAMRLSQKNGDFYIGAVSPHNTSHYSFVLIPHHGKDHAELFQLPPFHADRSQRVTSWMLPCAGESEGLAAPPLFAYSADGSRLAMTARDFFLPGEIGAKRALTIKLGKLLKAPRSPENYHLMRMNRRHLKNICADSIIENEDAQFLSHPVAQNDAYFAYDDQGLRLIKAIRNKNGTMAFSGHESSVITLHGNLFLPISTSVNEAIEAKRCAAEPDAAANGAGARRLSAGNSSPSA